MTTDTIDKSVAFDLPSNLSSILFKMGLVALIDQLNNWWYFEEEAQSDNLQIFTSKNIDGIWNSYPDLRLQIVNALIKPIHYDIANYPISREAAINKLECINNTLRDNIDLQSDLIRRKIIPYLYKDFDYKEEIIRIEKLCSNSSSELKEAIINSWLILASSNSKDEEFFNFIFNRVKRSEGATETKVELINKAFNNHVVPVQIIKKIANSAPISLKRAVVNCLTEYINSLAYSKEESPLSKRDSLEELALLFAPSKDRRILMDLARSLSIRNLPWILPMASQHPYVIREVQNRIDRGE